MSNAEARAWWSDVEHLHPDSETTFDDHPTSESRTGRITGRPLRTREAGEDRPAPRSRVRGAEPRLGRAAAAGFAEAFDLDGAFGAPRGRQDGPVSREIVLSRGAEPEAADDRLVEAADTGVVEIAPRRRSAAEAQEREAAARERLGELERAAEHEALLEPREHLERGPDGRRTVQIRGRAAMVPQPRLREIERRRPNRRPVDRVASRPDRIALYAVLLGIFLVVIAAASSSAQAAGF